MTYISKGPTVCARIPKWYFKDEKPVRVTTTIQPEGDDPIVFQGWVAKEDLNGKENLSVMFYVGRGGTPPPPPPPPPGD